MYVLAAKELETRAAAVCRSEVAVLEKHNELVTKARPDQCFYFQKQMKYTMDTLIRKWFRDNEVFGETQPMFWLKKKHWP